MKCILCRSSEYLVEFTKNTFDFENDIPVHYCLSCITAKLRLLFGPKWIEILEMTQLVHEDKGQVNQRELGLYFLIKQELRDHQGDPFAKKYLNENEDQI